MQESIYQQWIAPLKKYQKEPLQLHKLPIGSNAVYGYAIQDTAFLSQQFATENNAFYFNIADFLEAVHLNDQKRISNHKQHLRNAKRIITPELGIITDEAQKELSVYWLPLFTELKEIWTDSTFKEKRLIVPLQLVFGKMMSHASVACFNFKPKQDTVDVIVLEQHAQKKGEINYEADEDYTDGIKLHAKAFSAMMNQLLKIGTVNTFVNEKPICRRHNVCGVVASEVSRRLLETDDPMALVKSGIAITNEEVDKLHARNQKLEAKHGYFPLMVIQKNGGRK